MNNAIFITIYDQTPAQHELTKRAVESALAQNVPIDLYLIDNGSTFEPTRTWLNETASNNASIVAVQHYVENISPVKLANLWLEHLFAKGHQHVLGMPNDVILPSNFYRELLRFPRGIVTASMTEGEPTPCESAVAVNTCTPLAVALFRRWAYDALMAKDGYFFDPGYFLYASDCDLALRLSACGIVGVQLDIQYWHYRSASHRLADVPGAYGASQDRDYFTRKWGFAVFDAAYSAAAGDLNFLGVPNV